MAAFTLDRIEIADRALPRMRGLLGRSGLADGEGMLLRPAGSIHTFFMRFPIDVVFVDRHDAVVKIVPGLRPWRLAWARRAKSTLELRAGSCEAMGLATGARLAFAPCGEQVAR